MKRRDPAERFWEKVSIADGCWVWTARENTRMHGNRRHCRTCNRAATRRRKSGLRVLSEGVQ